MSQTSPFDTLPCELVSKIFELACQDECLEHCCMEHCCDLCDKDSLPEHGFTGSSLLAPIHISSRLREINQSHRPIWRYMAEKVLRLVNARQYSNTISLLQLCAELSASTLQRIELERMQHLDCSKRMLDYLKAIAPSAASLRALSFPEFPMNDGHDCKCPSCRLVISLPKKRDYDFRMVWSRLIGLLAGTTSLDSLTLDVHYLQTERRPLRQASTPQPRPRILQLQLATDILFSAELLGFLTRLASHTEELSLSIDIGKGNAVTSTNSLLLSLVESSHATLRRLDLHGDINKLTITALFLHHDLSLLERLTIDLDEDDYGHHTTPRALTTMGRPHLSRLQSLVAPAWLLPFFEAPNTLQSAAISFNSLADKDIITKRLSQWASLERLVMFNRIERALEASVVIQGIIEHLTPATSGPFACQGLKHFGITNEQVEFFQWLESEKKDEWESVHDEGNEEQATFRKTPVIGLALLHFERMRQGRWTKAEILSSDDSCQLQTVRILGCLVDLMTWTLLVEDSQSDTRKRVCQPEPWELQDRLGKQLTSQLRSHMAEILYQLSSQ